MKLYQRITAPHSRFIRNLLIGAILLCLVMQFFLALRFEINEDEFYNMNMGYEFLRGDVNNPIQTLMFRITSWLTTIQGNEIDQIIAGRMIAFGAAIVTSIFIYKTSRRYFGIQASLFALLAFFGFNFVFRHLSAFRSDALVTMCLMAVLWIVSDPNQSWRKVVTVGVLIGMAFSLALKSIFYMPIIAIFLLGRWITSNWSLQAFLYGLSMFVTAILTYALIFILHDTTSFRISDGTSYLQKISGNSLQNDGQPFMRTMFVSSLLRSFTGWGLLFLGFMVTLFQFFKGHDRPKFETIALLSFIIPVTSIIYYYHAYPYFYPFMLAPAVVFIAAAMDRFFVDKKSDVFFILICIYSLIPIGIFARSMFQNNDAQRTTIEAVRTIFPTSVPVIDCCGMISSFDRVNETGLFINPDIFGHLKYIEAGTPIITEIIKNHKPQLILANAISLDMEQEYNADFPYHLLPKDDKTIRDNYVKFWGPIYVPGKKITRDGPFEILLAGTYTYYGRAGARIDGIEVGNGQVMTFSRGKHEVSGLENKTIQLVWGDNLQKPDLPEPTKSFFNGF
jgi:hypothetical protein